MFKKIESPQNALIKQLMQLREKSRIRKKEGLFLVEGVLELQLALKSGYEFTQVLVCFGILSKVQFHKLFNDFLEEVEVVEINEEVYKKLAYRTSTEGVIGVAKTKNTSVEKLQLKTENPLILVAEAPEKPGNIGAILRTADAAGVDAVIIANPKTDLYNPNVIRSSVGGIFTNAIATGSSEEVINFLKEKSIPIYSAILQESKSCYDQDFTKSTAIVVGAEHEGLTAEWRKNATQNIHIPMSGSIDSMNVSVAAGILIFEAKRQRGF